MSKAICLIIVSVFLLTSCHVGRFFVYNFANLRDYKKFQEREIKASSNPYEFSKVIAADFMFSEELNVDYASPEELNQYHKDNKTVAFMVIQNDTIKYQYFDPKWEETDWVTSFSMSKSVISALVGIALEDGKIQSLDEPITNYIKNFKNEGFEKITIQHLLDMKTGIDYNESYYNPFGNVAAGYYGRNLDRHISNLKIKGPAGEKFEYISIATELLGVILEEATGENLSLYCEEKIWTKIGTSYNASWSLDRKNGREKAFCCINGVAEDFAKFAKLYLNMGNFEGMQVVPEEWVRKSVQLDPGEQYTPYQNQWWMMGRTEYGSNILNYAAQGHLGQLMFVNPSKNMIIVRFGKGWGNVAWMNWFMKIGESI
jgi:CubicO group peptidase (beta-lactamase class C family)